MKKDIQNHPIYCYLLQTLLGTPGCCRTLHSSTTILFQSSFLDQCLCTAQCPVVEPLRVITIDFIYYFNVQSVTKESYGVGLEGNLGRKQGNCQHDGAVLDD